MNIQNITWDQETVDHIAKHAVSPEEVEQVLFNDDEVPVIMRGKENKYLTYGKTDNGRFLFVGWAARHRKTRIITARDMTKKEKQFYRKRKK
ncbi:MAG: BrnT family toxin [bacterium]